jgi:hypothetical protein
MEEKYITLCKSIIESLVDKPEVVKVEKKTDDKGVLLVVYVDVSDRGKLIGRKGETIMAVRRIIKAVGFKEEANVSVKIDEPDRQERGEGRNEW